MEANNPGAHLSVTRTTQLQVQRKEETLQHPEILVGHL